VKSGHYGNSPHYADLMKGPGPSIFVGKSLIFPDLIKKNYRGLFYNLLGFQQSKNIKRSYCRKEGKTSFSWNVANRTEAGESLTNSQIKKMVM
jgi:hypothetical protein